MKLTERITELLEGFSPDKWLKTSDYVNKLIDKFDSDDKTVVKLINNHTSDKLVHRFIARIYSELKHYGSYAISIPDEEIDNVMEFLKTPEAVKIIHSKVSRKLKGDGRVRLYYSNLAGKAGKSLDQVTDKAAYKMFNKEGEDFKWFDTRATDLAKKAKSLRL